MDVDQVNAHNLSHVLERQKIDPETLNAGEGHWTPAKYYITKILGQREKEKGPKQPMRWLPKGQEKLLKITLSRGILSFIVPIEVDRQDACVFLLYNACLYSIQEEPT